MAFHVIENTEFVPRKGPSGFKNAEFRQLAGLFSRAASVKALNDMSVDVDFEEGVCMLSYYKTGQRQPLYTFFARQVGPRTTMYELWQQGKGRIEKSGLFERPFERLEREVETLIKNTL